jgi:uridylate kinase
LAEVDEVEKIFFRAQRTKVDRLPVLDGEDANADAVKFSRIDYLEVLNMGLRAMDSTATTLCMDNKIPIIVFSVKDPENLLRAVAGEPVGTLVC